MSRPARSLFAAFLVPLPLAIAALLIATGVLPASVGAEEEPQREEPAKEEQAEPTPDPAQGYKHLLETPYLPSFMDQALFDNLWRVWPEARRTLAEAEDPAARRARMYAHYGLTPRAADDPRPLQFVVTEKGRWHMNCFACHGGTVAGTTIPGAGNTQIALQSLLDDARATRKLLELPPSIYDLGPPIPMGETVGTTNAVVFSIVLLQLRDVHLNVVPPRKRLHLPHHDLDAPAWWNVKYKQRLYYDGFAKKNHRALMQFLLVPTNGKKAIERFAKDFRHIEAYIESIAAPTWPWPEELDATQVGRGREVFRKNCASCHGSYGETVRYPNRMVPMDKLGTDRQRLDSIRKEDRETYSNSWLTMYDPEGVILDPKGYIAPPLEGVWASAPYLHNGSVPTLYHLLFPEERPALWRRQGADYDKARGGLLFEAAEELPEGLSGDARRRWFDTRQKGKSNKGHDFPARLSREQRMDLLAYLKSL